MAPISNRKSRRREQKAARLQKLKRQLETSGALGEGKIVLEPPDQEKMSAVLLEFIEPYKELATTYAAYARLIALAIMAWNAAVFRRMGKPDRLDEAIKAIMASGDEAARRELREILAELIERKERHFPENMRIIVSYHLSETKKDYHLSVASIL